MAHHWSEREDQPARIEGLSAFLPSCMFVLNTHTGTGVRIEIFDAQPARLSRGKIRKRTDIGRLARQGR